MRRFYAQGFWTEKHVDPWITTVMIMVHFGLGIAILVGGVERFSLPSYQPLLTFTNDGYWVWGVVILISSILMSMPFRKMNILGLWIGMVWHSIWMACFIIAVIHYPTSASTPIPVYGGLSMICAALLTARIIDTTKE
jgi:hypothetical protein